jgi:hypothetical protein
MSTSNTDLSQWKDHDDELLRECLHVSMPGGLNDKERLNWHQIAKKMFWLASDRDMKNAHYNHTAAQYRYYDHIRKKFIDVPTRQN